MIDAHVHIFPKLQPWRPERDASPRGGGNNAAPANDTAYPFERLLQDMDAHGVEAAVILAGPLYGDWNGYTLEAMRALGSKVLAAAAFFDPWVDNAYAWYERDIAPAPFKAVKLECSSGMGLCSLHPGARLDDEPVLRLCRSMEKAGKALVLDLGRPGTASYQTEQVAGLAARYPDLRIIVCHIGQPGSHIDHDPALERAWREQILLAKRENVWMDFAALPCFMLDEPLPVERAALYLQRAAELVGVPKLIWGSDVPWMSRKADYGQIVEMARLHTAGFSKDERQMLLGGNAKNLWGE